MEKVHVGQRATITCQGLTITGTIESVFHDYEFDHQEHKSFLVGYYIELRGDDGHIHYWKSQLDGGSMIVHPDPSGDDDDVDDA